MEVRAAGSTLGERNLVERGTYSAHHVLEALVPTRVSWIAPTPTIAEARPEVVKAVMPVLAARTRYQQDLTWRWRLQSVPQRVAAQLVDLWPETTLGSASAPLPTSADSTSPGSSAPTVRLSVRSAPTWNGAAGAEVSALQARPWTRPRFSPTRRKVFRWIISASAAAPRGSAVGGA
ncbi:MAG: hypothetical protein J2P57_01550 [Acidimicrobiaceae bacterium]|nr:hypothetical protein [Acidimicrobiaceae bacterium]